MLLALQLMASEWKMCVIELKTAARICKKPEIVTARYELLCAFHCAPTHSTGGLFIM